jgi:CxxC motif-containing protein (DUF1111 family)
MNSGLKSPFVLALSCAVLLVACADEEERPPSDDPQSGGDTTVRDATRAAFSLPAANLHGDRRDRFFVGNAVFNRGWVTAPASVADFDGLGPLFNAASCSGCHFKDGRGRPPENEGEAFLSMLLRLSVPGSGSHGEPTPEPTYGDQLQGSAILGVPEEGFARVSYEEMTGAFADGEPYSLRKPTYVIDDLAYGPLAEGAMMSPRVAPHMVGLGLLELVPEDALLSAADPDDRDHDGISGRVNRVWDVGRGAAAIGRFGWKANQPSLRQQSLGAFLGDMGITSELFPSETCTGVEAACTTALTGDTPQLGNGIADDLVFYTRTLAVPARRDVDAPMVRRGRELFSSARCSSCHTPLLSTGESPDFPELSRQTIRPYTDLLLHDLGEGLADGRPDFDASGSEWRTPPLWGLGLVATVNHHSLFLHDGRARGFAEAILWHGGEARASRDAFASMPKGDRDALLAFLGSL